MQYYTISPVFKVALLIGNNLLPETEYNIQRCEFIEFINLNNHYFILVRNR